MRRCKTFLICAASLAVIVAWAAAGASATPHFYLQMETGEEFKKITTTTEANLSSNAEIEFVFSPSVKIHCHSEGVEKLFTTGASEITELTFSSCNLNVTECIVKLKSQTLPIKAELTEISSEPIVYGDKFTNFSPSFTVTNCAQAETYAMPKTNTVEGEVSNELGVEVAFPETPLKGTSLGTKKMLGRYRMTPIIGRQLRVGP